MSDGPDLAGPQQGRTTVTSTLGPDGPTLHEAEDRYLRDPLFHHRVYAAVMTLRIDSHGRPTGPLSEREQNIATQAAALGLLMSEFDPTPTETPSPPPQLRLLDT